MISIIIPLYNKENSIVSTLQSVLAQTYADYEVIIVDDGSTDDSLQNAENFIRLNSEEGRAISIRVIHQENAGVSSARNRGIIEAKGEYITFLDADDIWASDYLDTLYNLICDFPNAGLYSVGYRVITSLTPKEIMQDVKITANANRGNVQNPWNSELRLYIGSTCARKEEIIKNGMFDTRMTHGEDYDLCWRLILNGGLVRDTKCCAFYRMDSENRAMNRIPPIDRQMSYYIDKFAQARANNADFRRFFDEQMIYRLYPYLLDTRYRTEARVIAKQFDYSQLKWSMRFRMLFPRTYYLLRKKYK